MELHIAVFCTCSHQDPNNLCPGVQLCGEIKGELQQNCSFPKVSGSRNQLIMLPCNH